MSRQVKYGLLLLLLLIAGIIIYGLFYGNPSGPGPLLPADISITAPALADSFDHGEGHADSLYLYKTLSVSGLLERLFKNGSGRYVATLAGHGPGRTAVDCLLDSLYISDNINLKTGDSITIRGRCSGRSLNILLTECIIEK